MINELTTLGDVLLHGGIYDPAHFLYLPFDEVWNLSTRGAILPESDLDGIPDVAQKNGLQYALGVAAVHDIVANAREQLGEVSSDELLQAFLFFFDHDAYITFDV